MKNVLTAKKNPSAIGSCFTCLQTLHFPMGLWETQSPSFSLPEEPISVLITEVMGGSPLCVCRAVPSLFFLFFSLLTSGCSQKTRCLDDHNLPYMQTIPILSPQSLARPRQATGQPSVPVDGPRAMGRYQLSPHDAGPTPSCWNQVILRSHRPTRGEEPVYCFHFSFEVFHPRR